MSYRNGDRDIFGFFKRRCCGNLGSDFSAGLNVVSGSFRLQGMDLHLFENRPFSLPHPVLSLFAWGMGFVRRECRWDLGMRIFAGGHVFGSDDRLQLAETFY